MDQIREAPLGRGDLIFGAVSLGRGDLIFGAVPLGMGDLIFGAVPLSRGDLINRHLPISNPPDIKPPCPGWILNPLLLRTGWVAGLDIKPPQY